MTLKGMLCNTLERLWLLKPRNEDINRDWLIVGKIKLVTVQPLEEDGECCLMEQADYTRLIFRKPEKIYAENCVSGEI